MIQHELKGFLKYVVVGVLSNAIGYSLYLCMTYFQMPPKAAVTVLYAATAFLSFFGNRKVTFRHKGNGVRAMLRYFLAQAVGYALNILILVIAVDILGFDHRIVQAAAIIGVALVMFLMMRLFVFRSTY